MAAGTTVVPALRLQAITFTSPADGYGLFQPAAPGRCQDFVGRTTDGGARFDSLVRVASPQCDGNSPAAALAADRHGDAFLYGPRLFVTHDGGKNWARIPQPDGVLTVAAAGRSVWMLQAHCRPALRRQFAHACPLRVLRSADGGRSWRPTAAQPRGTTAKGDGSDPTRAPASLIAVGPSSAYVMASPDTNPRGRPDSASLWFTRDAGASWSRLRVPCGLDSGYIALSAAPDQVLAAVCASQPGAGSQPKTVVRSTDGGRVWTVRQACSTFARCSEGELISGYLGQVDAVSADTFYLVGDRSSLLVTRDGGVRWRAVRPLIGDTSGGTLQVQFFGRTRGIVLGADVSNNEVPTLWRTSDGGRHWSKLAVVRELRMAGPDVSDRP